MSFTFFIKKTKALLLSSLIVLCILTGCSLPWSPSNSVTHTAVPLTVGGKLDTEAQILTKLYVLLLRHAGFQVTDRSKTGVNDVVFQDITHGSIDLYPEFTTTGLNRLQIPSTGDPNQDYQAVKQGYEKNYHITWLRMSPNLNDTYGLCMQKSTASDLHITTISDLIAYAEKFTIAGSKDGLNNSAALPAIERGYGLNFAGKETIEDVEKTFQEVVDGQAQVNVCYTTSPLISQYNFVLLKDDKNVFNAYYPAPIIRDSALQKAPQIATILDTLSPRLNSEVSSMLQAQVASGFSTEYVATSWLKSQGLL